jgi:hypothetical protein
VRGEKGSGKSAIYSLLVAKTDDLFDKGILLATGEHPRGATVFKELVSEPPTSEQEFVGLWKLYLVTLIAQRLKEFNVVGKDYKELVGILEDQDLLEADFDLTRAFKQVRTYVSRWFRPKSIEGSLAVDPHTLIPSFAGKIVPAEPTKEDRARGVVSVDKLAGLADRALLNENVQIWVLLDRLDVAFVDSHDLEKNALRALFRVYRDFAGLDRVKLKIFLRSDIWKRITESGFREASHITRVAVLDWKSASLLNLVVKRLLNNPFIIEEFDIDAASVLRDFKAQSELFYRFFPKQVEQGSRKSTTFDWIISRCADANQRTAPREIIHLLNSVADEVRVADHRRVHLGVAHISEKWFLRRRVPLDELDRFGDDVFLVHDWSHRQVKRHHRLGRLALLSFPNHRHRQAALLEQRPRAIARLIPGVLDTPPLVEALIVRQSALASHLSPICHSAGVEELISEIERTHRAFLFEVLLAPGLCPSKTS